MASNLPSYPWQKVGCDLFQFNDVTYLLVVDYSSRCIEIAPLGKDLSSEKVISHLRSIFARHGIAEELRSDNGPQFSSNDFAKFSDSYGFKHTTSSPHFPQSNGEAERAVQTTKGLLQKATDPYLALLAYRSTPLQHGWSPAKLSMGRKLRSRVPVRPEVLCPEWRYLKQFQEADAHIKKRQKQDFDRRLRVRDLAPLQPETYAWLKYDSLADSRVSAQAAAPRSYIVKGEGGRTIWRNRRDIIAVPSDDDAA